MNKITKQGKYKIYINNRKKMNKKIKIMLKSY